MWFRWLLTAVFSLILAPINWACGEKLQLEGDFIQGGLVYGLIQPKNVRLYLDEVEALVHKDGQFVLGFDRDAPVLMELRVIYTDQQECVRTITVKKRQYKIQQIDGLPHQQVHPDQQALTRIQSESAEIRAAREILEPRADYRAGFVWPVVGPISGVYGSQRILNGEPRRPHYGVDVAVPVGTHVVAPAPGKITYLNGDMYFSGGTIVLDHGHGLSSSFLHLDEILVEAGQTVRQGDLIGTVGATGRVTGPHLDWRMNWRGAYIDPQLLVNPMPAKYH